MITLNILSFIFSIASVAWFVPTDTYHQPTQLAKSLLTIVQFLNTHIPLFPSSMILLLESQTAIATLNYLPQLISFGVWLIVFNFLHERASRKILLLIVSNLLVYIEILTKVSTHQLNAFLFSPLFLIAVTIWNRYHKRPRWEYYLLFNLFLLINTASLWLPSWENFIYNHLYLFFIPLRLWENIPPLCMFLMVLIIARSHIPRYFFKWMSILLLSSYLLLSMIHLSAYPDFVNSHWIWTNRQALDQYLVFSKSFWIPSNLLPTATVAITAKSAYQLYINEAFIGRGPGPIDERRRFFDEYEITPQLKAGLNTIKIVAYNYGHPTHFQSIQTGGVLAQFRFHIGPLTLTLPTDKSWLVNEQTGWQPVNLEAAGVKDFELNSGLYREIYDFGMPPEKPHLATQYAVLPQDNLVKRDIPALLRSWEEPVATYEKDNSWWCTFPHPIAGYPRFTFTSNGKTNITVRYYETINGSMVQEDIFKLPGAGTFTQSAFGRRGFAFIRFNWDKPTQVDINCRIETVAFPTDKVGTFSSSSQLLNTIYSMGENTLKYAMQDQFEDSFIHERSQYLGDAYVNMLMGFYSLDGKQLAKKALLQFASSQNETGLIETVYPSSLEQTILSYNLLFPIFLKDYYLYTGDTETLQKLLPVAEKIIAAFTTLRDQTGLINVNQPHNLKMGEVLTYWLDHGRAGSETIDINLSLTALYAKALEDLAGIFETVDISKIQALQSDKNTLIQSLSRHLTREAISSLEPHAATLLLLSDIDQTQKREIYLVLKRKAPIFITGYFNLFYLLAMHQQSDHQAITQLLDSFWGGMLRSGATSTWETFDPVTQTTRSVSQTHAWAGGPTYFLPAFITGLRPLTPGFRQVLVEPTLITPSASAKLNTACGKISVDWKKTTATFLLNYTNECGTETTFRLPFSEIGIKRLLINQQPVTPLFDKEKMVVSSKERQVTLEVIY